MVAQGPVNSSNSLPKVRISRLSRTVRALVRLQRKRSKSEVAPLGPTAPTSIRSGPASIPSRRSLSGIHFIVQKANGPPKPKPLTFREAFGLLGLPMVLMVLGCIMWTLWLIILSVAPNDAANFLMNTKDFDDGQFWLIPDEWSTLQVFSVAGLVVVLFLYVYVLLEMVLWRSEKNVVRTKFDSLLNSWESAATGKPAKAMQEKCFRAVASFTWLLYEQWKDYTGIHGKHRKFWNLLLKGHDMVMLTLFLRDLLEAGMPSRIVYGFAGLVAMNSLSCVVGIVFNKFTALAEILVDSLFDFGSTIIYPLTVLSFCSHNFHYDRAVFAINMELLPVGTFERRARMFTNPAEIALFRASFDSLRILDYTDLFLRIGMNLAFSYRYKRIVDVLLEIKAQKHIVPASVPRKGSTELKPVYFSFSSSTDKSGVPQKPVPRFLALFFVTYSIGIVLATHRAITTSQNVCSSHPQCVVFAYRWRDAEFCPCRALVDGDPAPRTYYEWTHPVDGTDTVKALAAAGTLETLQLMNRQLTTLPKELRGCHNLNLLCVKNSLINCATEELPVWTKDFRKLQYLQIEGKVGSENLGDLAPDLFNNMIELRYLQLGIQSRMIKMPSLEGAPLLRSIIYSRLYSVTSLPPLTRHANLERLELTGCKLLRTIPDLTPVIPLAHFSVFQGGQLCCNGFLGQCDLSNSLCQNATCLDDSDPKATPATLQVIREFSDAVCQPLAPLSQIPTPDTIKMCEGIPFKQCQFPGLVPGTFVVGMCYNHRMQVLACNPDPDKIKVRRRQIQEGVGVPCNPDVEAWLGCRNANA